MATIHKNSLKEAIKLISKWINKHFHNTLQLLFTKTYTV